MDLYEPTPLLHNAPRSAHNGGGVLSFADGRVIRKKWLDLASWPCVAPRGSCVGCRADHIDRIDGAPRDVGWLRQHTTVRIKQPGVSVLLEWTHARCYLPGPVHPQAVGAVAVAILAAGVA